MDGIGRLQREPTTTGPADGQRSSAKEMKAVIAFIVLAAAAGCESRDTRKPQEPIRLFVREPVLDGSRTQQYDILTAAANYPDRTTLSREGEGPMRPTKYGDPALDQAAIALQDIDRPWTLEKILAAYESEKAVERRVSLLRVLAASRDPKVAVMLHELVSDDSLEIRLAALAGLWDHYIQTDGVWGGGKEQMLFDEAEWWRLYKKDLLRAANVRDQQNGAREPSSSDERSESITAAP
jgi:hypothetical protein